MPDIVTGISLMLLFLFTKVERGYMTMLLAHITFDVPYVILSVLPKLKQMNKHTYEAALDLGATPTYALTHVIIPECKHIFAYLRCYLTCNNPKKILNK